MNGHYKRYGFLVILLLVVAQPFSVLAQEGGQNQPVYVGVKVCATCHQGKGMGHQFSKWLTSKHAGAYAVLAEPESKKIAELSGIPQEPQESAMCLGCHATGAHVEEWEKDETFFTEDGVQCEKCHGPGSEYMDASIMMDRQAAEKAGLMMPTVNDCMGCHQVKGSHVAIHKLPKLDIAKAMTHIAHPTPKDS
ncbi:MAG: multiheme c-type cytochrome, partial [Planctomycetota bacterium]